MSDTQRHLLGRIALKALTTRMVCLNCKRKFVVLKGMEEDCGECQYCENTSYRSEHGRPWGHKHRFWGEVVRPQWALTDADELTEDTLAMFANGESVEEYLYLASPAKTGARGL